MIPIAEPVIDDEMKSAVMDVLASGQLADGPEVRDFESEFADFSGVAAAIGTANGTTALHAALGALGIDDSSTVLTTPFSFIATANAAKLCGADVVFADIDPDTFNIDPHAVESRVRGRTSTSNGTKIDAIVVVHLYGLPAQMDHLSDIADTYDIPLVEDAAQAHGATFGGEAVGSIGDVGCFSFYPTKNMTTGEGGMITTDRKDIAERASRFINHGQSDRYEHQEIGHNFRMTSIAAAIGRCQLQRLPEFVAQRRANADRLNEQLEPTPVRSPIEPDGRKHVYHQYTIQTSDRNALKRRLAECNVQTGVYYQKCIHQQQPYQYPVQAFCNAEHAADTVLSLPVHPSVSETDVDRIASTITEYYV